MGLPQDTTDLFGGSQRGLYSLFCQPCIGRLLFLSQESEVKRSWSLHWPPSASWISFSVLAICNLTAGQLFSLFLGFPSPGFWVTLLPELGIIPIFHAWTQMDTTVFHWHPSYSLHILPLPLPLLPILQSCPGSLVLVTWITGPSWERGWAVMWPPQPPVWAVSLPTPC